jgi:hypothetical protein
MRDQGRLTSWNDDKGFGFVTPCLAMLGGWPGALVAQRMFHHKSKKASFQSLFRGIVFIHVVGLAMLATNFPLASVPTKIHDFVS